MFPQYGELNGPLAAEVCWRVWGTQGNLNGFHILASLLQRHCSPEVTQTLNDVWLSPGLVHYIYIFGSSRSLTEVRYVQNSLFVQVLRSPILAALLHGTPTRGSAKLCGMVQGMELQNFRRGRHLYSAGRPSRWASAHILVRSKINVLFVFLWLPYVIGQTIIFSSCSFFLTFFLLLFFSSPNLSARSLDVYHTSTHGVALVRI